MSEYIKLDDTVYFTANFYHPVSGFSYAADATPAWYVYESGATSILNGSMTLRDGIVGSYWSNFVASTANNFASGRFYDVQVSGTIGGVSGFSKVKEFVLSDVVDANILQVSGAYVHLEDFKADVSGLSTFDPAITAVAVSGIPEVNVVQVSGEYVYSDSVIDANIVQVSGVNITLTESIDANLVTVKGADFDLSDAVSVSGVVESNVVQVSGEYVHLNDFQTDISSLDADIYFANIKYISDTTNNKDEYAAQWFKNDQPVPSSSLTNPCISVYHTLTGDVMVSNQSMAYASPNLGVVRFDRTPMLLASGEPYLVEISGIIDGTNRVWKSIVGVDLL